MFVSKFFISKQNGIRQNVISSFSKALIVASVCLAAFLMVPNKAQADKNQTYVQQFQNNTTTLSGRSVKTSMYFTKMDYWKIKKVTFNFSYQISQLASRQDSDITVSINGTKFKSFRPKRRTGLQTEKVEIPLRLLQGENKLQIEGQVLNQIGNKNYELAQTPANWLTIEQGSNINFEYNLEKADPTLHSFYDHFSGQDTIAYQRARIVTANNPSDAELTASMIAMSGESRVITTENNQIQVVPERQMNAKKGDYLMIVAAYQHLPKNLKRQVNQEELSHYAIIKTYYTKGKHYLIVTSKKARLLKKAARFVANAELMNEVNRSQKFITSQTATFTSSLHDNGVYQLSNQTDKVEGAGHQESSYLITLPNDRSNADGSHVTLHFRYSQNLNFARSLVTISVNNTTLGSKKLTKAKASGDELTLTVPKGTSLGSSFVVKVAFDLEMKGQSISDNSQTPWAEINSQSEMIVKSQISNDLLFNNYPTLFIKNETYNDIAVVIPENLTTDDFRTLTNIFNLIGSFAKSNTGSIQFYNHPPREKDLKDRNVIVVGTPQNNSLIRKLNANLYFQYDSRFQGIKSNEKLSIEKEYGKTIGTAQLLRSPYNHRRGMLVVTGKSSRAVYLASTQINFQKNIQQYTGDAIVVDQDNNHYGYRFKKNKFINQKLAQRRSFSKHSQLIIYLGLALLVLVIIGIAIFLTLRKQGLIGRHATNDKKP